MIRITTLLLLTVLNTFISCAVDKDYNKLFNGTKKLIEPYGICIHHNSPNSYDVLNREAIFSLVDSLGVNYSRCGIYYFSSDHERYESMNDSVMNTISLHNKKYLPITMQTIDGVYPWEKWPKYSSWLDYCITRYGGQLREWEIVNEIDIARRNLVSKKQRAHEYSDLLKKVYVQIKAKDKNLQVVMGGMADFSGEFFETLLNDNALDYCDIMNIHYYTYRGEPETILPKLKKLSKQLKKASFEGPLWVTETGYPTGVTSNISEEKQAQRIARSHLICFASGVDKVFWYNLRAYERDSLDNENQFGIVHKDLSPKQGYYAYKTMTTMCPGNSSRPELQIMGTTYLCSWIRPDRKRVWAIWNSEGIKNIMLKISGHPVLYDYMGNRLTNVSSDEITIGQGVIYIVDAKKVDFK